jgi:magnesium-protoporphyrin O-methyltransferase
LLVFSYPPRNLVSRLFISAENPAFKLLRREYRSFAHPQSAMLGLLGERGLRRTFVHHSPVWQVAGLER